MLTSGWYLKQLQALHDDPKRPQGFGGKVKKLGVLESCMLDWSVTEALDYGCGKGLMLQHLQQKYPSIQFTGYDPAVEKYETMPVRNFQMLYSVDVLEHIEPEYLDGVLDNMNHLSNEYLWLRIDTLPARKSLPDGRNAHLILETPDWWIDKLNIFNGDIIYQNYKKGKFDVAIRKTNSR